jgi:hypothetical protein
MPKSRHSHRKPQPKRRQITPTTPVSTKQAVAQPAPAPKVVVSAPATAVATTQYPYITTELKGIGIVTGIIIVILVVLFFVLR